MVQDAPLPAQTRYREIYNRIRASIADGALRPGDRLPSARALAAELKVARGTVDTAYALLVGEGFLVSRRRTGTRVSTMIPAAAAARTAPLSQDAAAENPDDFSAMFARPLPLMPGLPAFDLFPRTLWFQLLGRHARRSSAADLSYPDPLGAPPLREALAAYLAVARGIRCSPDQILVTGGYLPALVLICRALLAPGAKAWVENPVYPFTSRAIAAVGGQLVPVRVDSEGLDVEAGQRAAPDATLCVVGPASQFPLGVVMSLRRRLALLEWADQAGAWIVEDDYVGEFRYEGAPLPALKSIDRQDRVFYVGTFSKTLFPGLRLGYVVAPRSQLAGLKSVLRRIEGGRPTLEQLAVADFLDSGHFARHVKRMRTAYRSRRAALVTAFSALFSDRLPLDPAGGGLHILARAQEDDRPLAEGAVAAGFHPIALSRLDFDRPRRQGLLLGFSTLPETQAEAAVLRLAQAWGPQ